MSNAANPLTSDPIALWAMLAEERAENERLRQIIKELQRHRFGRRAESLPVDQLLLGVVEGGIPTEATVAHVLVAKYADHLPLFRQAQIYSRQGVNLDRSTLADWVGKAAFLLRPVHERLFERLKASTKLFADETTAPVLDPGRGRTKTGQLFAYARDERPWAAPIRRV